MKYMSVIFDLDGTLLDTIDDLADSMNWVLKKMGFPEHSLEAYKYFVGDGMKTLAMRVLPEAARTGETIMKCYNGMVKEYDKRWADKTRPYEGINELLDILKKMNVSVSVLSNKPDRFTQIVVEKFFDGYKFAHIIGESANIPKKPDIKGALFIAESLKLKPSQILYVGDTNTDMKTAVAAKMHAVGALWGFRTERELIESGAQTLIARPCELIEKFYK